MKTIIQTEIKGNNWLATTPNAEGLIAEAKSESEAVNALIANIRKQIKDGGEDGIAWASDAKPADDDKNKITRWLTGCWPPVIKETKPKKSANRKDVTDA